MKKPIIFEDFKELIELLNKNNLSYYIFGGFAVDGLAGRLTRVHFDADLLAWDKDKEKLNRLLKEKYHISKKGYVLHFQRKDFSGDILFLEKRENKIIVQGNIARCIMPPKFFDRTPAGKIQDFSFPIVPVEFMYSFIGFCNENDKNIILSNYTGPKKTRVKTRNLKLS